MLDVQLLRRATTTDTACAKRPLAKRSLVVAGAAVFARYTHSFSQAEMEVAGSPWPRGRSIRSIIGSCTVGKPFNINPWQEIHLTGVVPEPVAKASITKDDCYKRDTAALHRLAQNPAHRCRKVTRIAEHSTSHRPRNTSVSSLIKNKKYGDHQ